MAKWRLAKGLEKLREQVNLAAPNRSRDSDGSIGDTSHSARASDHNPNSLGVVTAIDVTHDPKGGVDGAVLSRQLVNDPRAKYVIFAGQIWKARTGTWEKYRGANKHEKHVHVSIKAELADNVEPWPLTASPAPPATPASPRILKLENPMLRGEDVLRLQKALGARGHVLQADGVYGFGTEKVIKKFQVDNGLEADGIVGPATLKKLGL